VWVLPQVSFFTSDTNSKVLLKKGLLPKKYVSPMLDGLPAFQKVVVTSTK
jgi:hypothetical protein